MSKDPADIVRDTMEKFALTELARVLRAEINASLGDLLRQGDGNTETRASALHIVINNNTGAAVSARETTDAFNRRQLEITIDQMVAESLMRGSRTTGVLRTLFGLAPGLIGR